MPSGAAGNPNFEDFANHKEAQTTQTHHLSGAIRQIGRASLTADFNGGLNLSFNRRLRGSGHGEFSLASRFFSWQKSENKWGRNDG